MFIKDSSIYDMKSYTSTKTFCSSGNKMNIKIITDTKLNVYGIYDMESHPSTKVVTSSK